MWMTMFGIQATKNTKSSCFFKHFYNLRKKTSVLCSFLEFEKNCCFGSFLTESVMTVASYSAAVLNGVECEGRSRVMEFSKLQC